EGKRRRLTKAQVKQLAELGRKIEEHYRTPQDAEWAVPHHQMAIVQSRPVTAMQKEQSKAGDGKAPGSNGDAGEVLVRGLSAAPGVGTGPARVLKSLEESGKLQEGDVLVARMT